MNNNKMNGDGDGSGYGNGNGNGSDDDDVLNTLLSGCRVCVRCVLLIWVTIYN